MNVQFETYLEALGAFVKESVLLLRNWDAVAICRVFRRMQKPYTWRSIAMEMMEELEDAGKVTFQISDMGMAIVFTRSANGFSAKIAGEGRYDRPEAYLVLTMLLQKHSLLGSAEFDGESEPLSDEWLDLVWDGIDCWAWEWVRDHPELLPASVGKSGWGI